MPPVGGIVAWLRKKWIAAAGFVGRACPVGPRKNGRLSDVECGAPDGD